MRKTIKTKTIYGVIKVKAITRKWLAINRNEDDYWVVTHVPTGCKFPGYFLTKADAIAASKLARWMFPYPLNQNLPTQGQWFMNLRKNNIYHLE